MIQQIMRDNINIQPKLKQFQFYSYFADTSKVYASIILHIEYYKNPISHIFSPTYTPPHIKFFLHPPD